MGNPASNTRGCFTEFVGHRLLGVLFDGPGLGSQHADLHVTSLVFQDGRALTLCSNGSYWIDTAEDVRAATTAVAQRLEQTQSELADVLALAGRAELSGPPST